MKEGQGHWDSYNKMEKNEGDGKVEMGLNDKYK